jgi:hypothetical protein
VQAQQVQQIPAAAAVVVEEYPAAQVAQVDQVTHELLTGLKLKIFTADKP